MKKTISIVLFVALTAIALCGLCACGTLITYPDAGMYSYDVGVNGTTSQGFVNKYSVDNIDIDWISGQVNIVYDDVKEITLTETSNKELDDKSAMHWYPYKETLYIKYGAGNFYSKVGMKKTLTVTLPSEFACKDFMISMASGNFNCKNLVCEKFSANLSSGDIDGDLTCQDFKLNMASGIANVMLAAQSIDVDIASGDIDLLCTGNSQTVDISSNSGHVGLWTERVENLTIDSSSGAVEVNAHSLGIAKITQSSGNLQIVTNFGVDSLTCALSSGNITLRLGAMKGFTAKTKTSSGKVSCDYPVTKNGDTLVYGDGSSQLDLRTSSGKITIKNN